MDSSVSIIHNEDGNKITVANLVDLQMLPDKSLKILFNNSNYSEVIYLYTLHRLDMYLEHTLYTKEAREDYFTLCFNIIPKLIEYQEYFLLNEDFPSGNIFDTLPREIFMAHQHCLESTCNFFRGILSATPYINHVSFPLDKLLIVKHNYSNICTLLCNI